MNFSAANRLILLSLFFWRRRRLTQKQFYSGGDDMAVTEAGMSINNTEVRFKVGCSDKSTTLEILIAGRF